MGILFSKKDIEKQQYYQEDYVFKFPENNYEYHYPIQLLIKSLTCVKVYSLCVFNNEISDISEFNIKNKFIQASFDSHQLTSKNYNILKDFITFYKNINKESSITKVDDKVMINTMELNDTHKHEIHNEFVGHLFIIAKEVDVEVLIDGLYKNLYWWVGKLILNNDDINFISLFNEECCMLGMPIINTYTNDKILSYHNEIEKIFSLIIHFINEYYLKIKSLTVSLQLLLKELSIPKAVKIAG